MPPVNPVGKAFEQFGKHLEEAREERRQHAQERRKAAEALLAETETSRKRDRLEPSVEAPKRAESSAAEQLKNLLVAKSLYDQEKKDEADREAAERAARSAKPGQGPG